MPTALENLIATLKREREAGAHDTAVEGGLGAYAAGWQSQAREQARRPRHQILIDEVIDSLADYATQDRDERVRRINYLIDRVTNRAPAPPMYAKRLPDWEAKMPSQPKPPRKQPREKRERHGSQREARQYQSKRRKTYDGDSWDDDYATGGSGSELDLPVMLRLARPPRMPQPERSASQLAELHAALDAPTTEIKGIGKKFAEHLARLDLHTARDMLYNFPRAYHDYTRQQCIQDIEPDGRAVTIIATVQRFGQVRSGGRNDLTLVVSDGTGRLTARFFGQGYLAARFRAGMPIVLHGRVNYFRDAKSMSNPQWEELDLDNLTMVGIVPVYASVKGMRPRMLRRAMQALTAEWADNLPDPLPSALLDRCELADLGWAIRQRHFPDGDDHLKHARRRLVFDELLTLQLALLGARREWQSLPAQPIAVDDAFVETFVADAFPYDLTEDQARVVGDLRVDMANELPMNRLLQGDVGSGKTAVAIIALAVALQNGKQGAIMTPTGILAEQHYRSISATFASLEWERKPTIALLTGALSASEREAAYAGLANGEIDIAIGTHALIQPGLDFHDLALAIIDEQHRFGADQRGRLRGKGRNPHLLVMSATPFPRSLALTLYADLDLSVISQLPAGRKPVKTAIIEPIARERLHGFVESELEKGRQAFFVHPLVEESESVKTASALEACERLRKVFYRHRVALLHGRMSASEKDTVMEQFARHEHDVLVTTTVAEVGVDVPNASVIVIDGANRFGLAQLHQFRGRVGRGAAQSWCFLLPDSSAGIRVDRIREAQDSDNDNPAMQALSNAERRLAAVESTNDGFELAELDMQLRGSGSLPGKFQSGANIFQRPDKLPADIIELAQREARTLYEEDPRLLLVEHQQLAQMIRSRYQVKGDIS